MDPLVHRLKELDQITFQHLCFHLMAEKYPSANVRYVEGASGDEGLDLFHGDLASGPTIWQCKSFQVSLIGNSQKDQIRKSLRDAITSSSPRLWVLCLNLDFDTKAHRWFQHVQDSYAPKGVQLQLVQGSDIVHELIFRHTLRDHYFPNASLLDEVRKLLPRSRVLAESELELVPGEAIDDYIERLRARDPRFIYEITLGGDRGPTAFPPPPEPGIVAAFTDGQKTVKAFARDPEALRQDPVEFSVTVAGLGVEKMMSAIRTGKPQHFSRDEIKEFKGNFPFLSFLKVMPGEFELSLSAPSVKRTVPLRLSFVGKTEQLVYELVEFETTRAGSEEVEISMTRVDLPLRIRFVFPTPIARSSQVHIDFEKRFVGSDVLQARKALRTLQILQAGCEIKLFSLQKEKPIGAITVPPTEFRIQEGMSRWIETLARVSEHFGVPITVPNPRDVSEQDFGSLEFLYALASGEGLQIENMHMTLVKSDQNSDTFPMLVRNPRGLTIVNNDVTFQLCGTQIGVGSCGIQFGKAEVKDPERVLLEFHKAEIGSGIPLSIHPLEPVKAFLAPNDEKTR